jgi:phosphoenolpyruvate---glycerone phosphotransferase subunit DhaL
VAGRTELDGEGLAEAFDAAAEGLARRGRCRLGDKTIYDALRPAADALGAATRDGADIATALGRAAAAANWGMRSTRPLIARRGLALRLGERSRGHQDPGATSCFLLVRAMLPDRRP